jgi:hypothetical protein
MAVTAAQFRVNFPEFASTTQYPDSAVNFWLAWAYKLLRTERWQDILDLGVQLFVAHNLVLERTAQNQAASGGVPAGQTGNVASKAVAQVSVSYDNASSMDPDAGHWALTIFGKRFLRLMRMAGSGGVQL